MLPRFIAKHSLDVKNNSFEGDLMTVKPEHFCVVPHFASFALLLN